MKLRSWQKMMNAFKIVTIVKSEVGKLIEAMLGFFLSIHYIN